MYYEPVSAVPLYTSIPYICHFGFMYFSVTVLILILVFLPIKIFISQKIVKSSNNYFLCSLRLTQNNNVWYTILSPFTGTTTGWMSPRYWKCLLDLLTIYCLNSRNYVVWSEIIISASKWCRSSWAW